jgi:WD40 repeat protein
MKQKTALCNYDLSADLIFQIYLLLDYKSILAASAVCKLWRSVFIQYEHKFWQQLLLKMFRISVPSTPECKTLFKTHLNFHQLKYKFISAEDDLEYNEKVEFDIENIRFKEPLFIWPADFINSYLVSLDGNLICWLDRALGPTTEISVGTIDFSNNIINSTTKLSGHSMAIGLILGNGMGKLCSCDAGSMTIVWNLKTMQKVGEINTALTLRNIISMNIQKNKLVAGGANGKVVVWDIDSLEMLLCLNNEEIDDIPLNVGIYDNIIVFGLSNGVYVVYDQFRKQIIHELNTNLEETSDLPYIPRQLVPPLNFTETFERDEETTSNHIPNLENFDNDTFMVPRTLALNSHILVTNGPTIKSILMWDLNTGKQIATLSESLAMRRYSLSIEQLSSIKVAEFSPDSSVIYSCVEQGFGSRLVIWDFYGGKRKCSCMKFKLSAETELQVWAFFLATSE